MPQPIVAPAPLEATSSPPTPARPGTFTFTSQAPAPPPTAPASPERASTTANLPNGNSTGAASTTANPRDAVPPPSTTVAEAARAATAAPATQESTSSPLAPALESRTSTAQPSAAGGAGMIGGTCSASMGGGGTGGVMGAPSGNPQQPPTPPPTAPCGTPPNLPTEAASATANGTSHAGVAGKVEVARRARDKLDAAVAKHRAAEQSLADAVITEGALIAEGTAPACDKDAAKAARVAAEQALATASDAKDAASKTFGEAMVALEPNWDFEKPLMLTEGTMVLLETLWLILDKTSDSKISKEDFLPFAGHFKHLDTQGGDGGERGDASGRRAGDGGRGCAARGRRGGGKGGEGETAPPQLCAAAVAQFGATAVPPPFGAAAAAPFGTAKWQEMSEHFDTDDSGDITPVEFIDGFKKIAMGSALDWEGIKSMPEQTYLDVQAKINKSVNRRLQNLVKEAHERFAQDAVPPCTVIKSNPGWSTEGWIQVSKRSADQLLINAENKLKIEGIFNHLDQTNDGVLGVLTREDFGPRTPGEVSLRESRGPLPFGRRPPHPARRSRRGPSAAQLAPARLRAASGCCLGI